MYVKKFEGDTLDEALKSVKRELGPDAIILKTVTNKGLKGAFKKNRIEITAAISEQSYAKKSRVDHVLPEPERERFYQAPASRINNMINEYDTNRGKKAGAGYGNIGLNKVVNTVSNKIKNSLDDFLAIEEEEPTQKDHFDQFLEAKQDEPEYEEYKVAEPSPYEQARYQVEANDELKEQIKTQKHQIELLEKKLFELTERVSEKSQSQVEPKGIKGLRATLRSLELSEKIVQNILKKAVFEMSDEELEDPDLIYDFALREIHEMIKVGMPKFSTVDSKEEPVVTVLVSESSSGQGSMAIKLAAIQENVKVIRFREHPQDQDKNSFAAQIFKLDITTVDSLSLLMSEARKAIENQQSMILDLRLSFADENESKKFLDTIKRAFNQVEFIANLSAINSEIYNRKILTKYQSYLNGVNITYIDQCLSFGPVVNLSSEFSELPLMFFGTGAVVPEDIEAASVERVMAELFQL